MSVETPIINLSSLQGWTDEFHPEDTDKAHREALIRERFCSVFFIPTEEEMTLFERSGIVIQPPEKQSGGIYIAEFQTRHDGATYQMNIPLFAVEDPKSIIEWLKKRRINKVFAARAANATYLCQDIPVGEDIIYVEKTIGSEHLWFIANKGKGRKAIISEIGIDSTQYKNTKDLYVDNGMLEIRMNPELRVPLLNTTNTTPKGGVRPQLSIHYANGDILTITSAPSEPK